jgi:hypothetical protein
MSNELALSLTSQYRQEMQMLSKPVSSLAKRAGLNANQVYLKLVPALAGKDLGETIRFAEIAIKYASIVDRNRLREEVGEAFFVALDQVVSIVESGLESREPWIQRKAMLLHGSLIDEAAEKQRFVDTIIGERKYELIKMSQQNIEKLRDEIIEFEMSKDGTFEVIEDAIDEQING